MLLLPLPQLVVAQLTPRPITPEPQPFPQPELLPPPEELLQPFPTPQTPEEPILDIPDTITITGFKIIGNTVFSLEEIRALLQDYINRPISFNELLETPQIITQLYRDRGYITSGAFLPPQQLDQGVITLEIIEGQVEEIEIQGLERLKPNYIRSRIEAGIQPPLNQNQLLETLQLLQLNPLIERLAVELSAGSQVGLSQLQIQLQEADTLSVELAIDNQRSPSVGSVRRLGTIHHYNLMGWGDHFQVSYYNTDGSHTLDNLSYSFPINGKNGTLSFRHRRTDSQIIEDPFNELDIESNSQSYEFSFRQPLYFNPTTELAMGLTTSLQDSQTFLEAEPFQLSSGANNEGETRVVVLRFFQDYSTRSPQDALAVRSQFSIGLDALNSTVNQNEPDSRFLNWRGQAQYLRLIAPETLWLVRADLQLSDQSLLAQEQFSLGGATNVRGYRQDLLLGDQGIFLSTEFRVPLLQVEEWNLLLQVIPFVDWGMIGNKEASEEMELDQTILSSVGLGMKLQMSDYLIAQLDWGIPLTEIETVGDSWREKGLHFSILYQVNF